MAKLQFYPLARKNPRDESVAYYAQKSTYSNIPTAVLCRRIVENTAVPPGVVRAAVTAIVDSVANFVCNGHSVQLGELMSMRPTAQTKGAVKATEFKAEMVKRVMVRVAWGANVVNLQRPGNYEWERLTKKPSRHEAPSGE